jgi:hypothetical protein
MAFAGLQAGHPASDPEMGLGRRLAARPLAP